MTTTSTLSTIILAAGKGTRMKSEKAKVLHELFFAPMIHHVLQALVPLGNERNVIIVGHQRERVLSALKGFDIEVVVQEEQLGTGHAALCAEKILGTSQSTIMILCGDTPLIQTETLRNMYEGHLQNKRLLTVMTTHLDNPTNYGRIITDENENVLSIVEEKDATAQELNIREINAGIYCVDSHFLFEALKQVGTDNSQGEVYLTDIVSIAVARGHRVGKYATPYPQDVLGVNSRIELAEAHQELQMRHNRTVMLQGITMYSPETILIEPTVSIGTDTILSPSVQLVGKTTIGKNCFIGQGVILHDCVVEDGAHIGPYSCISQATIASGAQLKPYSEG